MSKIARNRTNAKKINKFLYMFKLKTKHHLTFRLQSSRRSIHIYIERDRVRQRETERERERERTHFKTNISRSNCLRTACGDCRKIM